MDINKIKMRTQAKEIFETWEKDTLVEALLDGMNVREIKQFIKDNQ